MFVANISSSVIAMEVVFPKIPVQRLIFSTDMLWESCQIFNFTPFCFLMFFIKYD